MEPGSLVLQVSMVQRFYDPALGRFLSVDPVGPLENPINHFGRYHYANNNPYRYTDPDGRYACEGGKAACAAVAKQVGNIAKAAEALPQGSEGRQALARISSFFGKPGEANGVVVKADADLGGVADGRARIDSGVVTIRVDSQGITERSGSAAPDVLANALVHEGSHGVDQKRAGSMTYSRSELHQGEVRAYQAQGSYAQGSGRDVFGMLKSDGSVDGAQVQDLARQSVQLACQTGACRD